jgi:FkbM family methyltransferase
MEDILLDRVLTGRTGTFMDVGAHHPIVENNTYFFYLRGWRGVNLEPLRHFYELFLEHRPQDINLNVAASNVEGTATFYEVAQSPGLSTLSPEVANDLRLRGHEIIEHTIRVVPIRSLIQEHRLDPPDILSVDVESHEHQVFEGIPLDLWRPKVLVVESTLPNSNIPSHQKWEPILKANGYHFASFNGINRFYLREDLKDKIECFQNPVNFLDLYRRYETVFYEEYVRDLEGHIAKASAAWAAERHNFEAARVGWGCEREQLIQAREAWERERATWQEAQENFGRARAEWERERQQLRQDQTAARCQSAELRQRLEELDRARETAQRQALEWRQQAQDLAREKEAAGQSSAELRRVVEGQQQQLAAYTTRIELLANREKELRAMLLDMHAQLLRRDEDFQLTLAARQQQQATASPDETTAGEDNSRPVITGPIAARNGTETAPRGPAPGFLHPRWEMVRHLLLPGAGVIVVSEGDDELLQLGGRAAWHFPQTASGAYDDQLPADAAALIAHLEEVQAQGARFLLFPPEALWWLGYYPEFAQYLEEKFPFVTQEDEFLLFELPEKPTEEELRWHHEFVHQVRDLVQRQVHPKAWILVVTLGDEALIQFGELFGGRRGSHFPQTEDGSYAVPPPTDSAAVIAHLEELRAQGAQYLLVAGPMRSWLDQYEEFKQHVEKCYGTNLYQEDAGLLFSLTVPSVTDQDLYNREIDHVQDLVNRRLPPGAIALVLSQGDERFVRLGQRVAWHFPRTETGAYAGYPADNDTAIDHLEEMRARGAEFLVVPYPAYYWLEYYGYFRLHLEAHYRLVTYDPLVPEHIPTLIYALTRFTKRPVTDRPFGANVAGNLSSEKGVGEAVRSVIRSLQAADIPHVLNNWVDAGAANQDATFADFAKDNPYRFNILQANADAVPYFVATKGEPYLHEHHNIGYWFWELADFPRKWDPSFQYLDEIWAGSHFGVAALSRVSPVPVVRIPLSVTDCEPTRPWQRSDFGLSPDAFVLFIFDFHSVMERKNPLGLIEAFKRAFSPEENVWLVLKSVRSTPEQLEALTEAAQGANVQILDTFLSREEVLGLLYLSDCYVSLHRSEGFGYTLAEAMSLGKPVIATGYSGNMDFMTTGNSFLVNYHLVELPCDYDPYEKGSVWADPDLDHAAELMRFIYQNPEVAREIGDRGQEEIFRQLSPQAVGQLIRDRLLRLSGQ